MDGTSGAEEWVQVNFRLTGQKELTTQAKLQQMLEGAKGVKRFELFRDEVHLLYDPLETSERELAALLETERAIAREDELGRDSPFAGGEAGEVGKARSPEREQG